MTDLIVICNLLQKVVSFNHFSSRLYQVYSSLVYLMFTHFGLYTTDCNQEVNARGF